MYPVKCVNAKYNHFLHFIFCFQNFWGVDFALIISECHCTHLSKVYFLKPLCKYIKFKQDIQIRPHQFPMFHVSLLLWLVAMVYTSGVRILALAILDTWAASPVVWGWPFALMSCWFISDSDIWDATGQMFRQSVVMENELLITLAALVGRDWSSEDQFSQPCNAKVK